MSKFIVGEICTIINIGPQSNGLECEVCTIHSRHQYTVHVPGRISSYILGTWLAEEYQLKKLDDGNLPGSWDKCAWKPPVEILA